MATQNSTVDESTSSEVLQGTNAGSGVPQGTATQVSVDAAELQRQLAEAQAQLTRLENDRRKQQSVLQSQNEQTRKTYEQQLELANTKLKEKMTDQERKDFEVMELRQQLEAARAERDQIVQQSEQQRIVGEWVTNFSAQFEIDPTAIDTSSQETMLTSAFNALADKFNALKGKPAVQQKVQRPQPGPTISGAGQPPATTRNAMDIYKAMNADRKNTLTLDEFFRMAERGEVDLSQIR